MKNMWKKSLVSAAMAAMLVFSLMGCGSKSSDGGDSDAEGEDQELTVAGIVYQDDQFMQSLTQGYEDAAEEYGVKLLTANANNDQAKETELINTYVTQGVDGIAIAPIDPSTSIATLESADEQGVKICLTNMAIDDADFIVGGFTSDDYQNAYDLGTVAAERLKEEFGDETIKIGVLNYEDTNPTQSATREQGYFDALDDGGVKYEIVAEATGSTVETDQQAARDMLTANPDIQSLWACNGLGYIGAYAAITSSNLQQVVIYGYDANDQTTDYLYDGTNLVWGEVAQDPYTMGYKAMELLIKNLQGEDTSEYAGKTTIVPGVVLTNDDFDGVNEWRESMGYPAIEENLNEQ